MFLRFFGVLSPNMTSDLTKNVSLGSVLGIFWGTFGMIMGSFWDDFETILEQFWDDF